MKKLSFMSLTLVLAMLLAACQFHTGLGGLVNGNQPTTTPRTKKAKATHTPPSPAASSTAASSNAVAINSSGDQPATLEVKVGTVVTWTNTDSVAHSVTSDTANVFDSGPLNNGATFTFTFTQPGTYTYHSSSDPNMTGTITVTQ